MAEVPSLAPDEAKVREGAEEVSVVEAETAFVVFVSKTGEWGISPDINMPLTTERTANLHDMKAGLSVAFAEIQKEETAVLAAQHVLNAQMQMAQQVREAQLNQGLLQGKQLRA